MNILTSLFTNSPIPPLQKHMATSFSCVQKMIEFAKHCNNQNWEKAKALQLEIVALENAADRIKEDLHLHFPRSIFSPIPRGDILFLLNAQEKIANQTKDLVGLMMSRKTIFPVAIRDNYHSFLHTCTKTVEEAKKAIDHLDELLATSFQNEVMKLFAEVIKNIRHLEEQTDQEQVELRTKLFEIEKTLLPIDCFFLYKIITKTGNLADLAKEVGDQLGLLLAK